MIKLKIDPEFRDKIPAMPQEDFDGLRADILRDGYVRDPLVVWKEENILLDGHHRWKVITENEETLADKFQVDYKSFPDRWAAIAWICANQLHKHNMTELQRMKLIHEEYEARQHSEKFKGNQYTRKSGDGEIPQKHFTDLVTGENKPLPPPKNPGKEPTTRNIIAEEHKISPDDVRSAVEVGRGIDRAASVDPNFKREVLSGEVKATKSSLAAIRKMKSDDEVKEAIEEIRKPKEKKPRPMSPQMKDFTKKMLDVVADMETVGKPYGLDDAICELNGAEDVFFTQIRFVLEERKEVIAADERGREQIIGFIESVIHDLNELKGEL